MCVLGLGKQTQQESRGWRGAGRGGKPRGMGGLWKLREARRRVLGLQEECRPVKATVGGLPAS